MSFRQSLPKDKITIAFDTTYRNSGNVSMPIFNLNETIKRVGKIYIDKIVFPCSYFIFNEGNNFLGNINAVDCYINANTYTTSTLSLAIKTSLQTAGYANANCIFANDTFTISSGGPNFSLNINNSLVKLLGFSSNKSGSNSYTSDYPVYESRFVIVGHNNKFKLIHNNNNYTFTITPGNYTGYTLATEVETQINLQLNNAFSVVYNSNNYTLTISHNASFTFDASESATTLLGFIPGSNVASTNNKVISPNSINIYGPTSIMIKSKTLSLLRQMTVRSDIVYNESIYELLLAGNNGSIIYDDPEDSAELFMAGTGGATISSIDFRICDDTGKIVDLRANGRWKIYLIFELY